MEIDKITGEIVSQSQKREIAQREKRERGGVYGN